MIGRIDLILDTHSTEVTCILFGQCLQVSVHNGDNDIV